MRKYVFDLSVAIVATGGLFFFLTISPETMHYRALPEERSDPRATILFGGDLLFDRSIRLAMEREGEDYGLSCIADLLRSADLVVANLEGPITSNPSKSAYAGVEEPDNVTFTFPTTTAHLLARHNIRVVNLGNNHILNFGVEGYRETLEWLHAARVDYFGDPGAGLANVLRRGYVRGIPLSFINWNDWGGASQDDIEALVGKEREAGYLSVVYTHWGEEYVPASDRMRDIGHRLIEAGAEIVVGSHPHVVQEHELYRGKYIYYSLGNMIFDQYWDESVRRGLLLRVKFSPQGVSAVEEIPIENQKDRRTCPV